MKLGIQEAARLLSVSEKTVYRWVRGGLLPVYRVNGQYRFHRPELLAWAISRRMNVPEEVFHDSLRVTGVIPTLAEAVQRGGIFYRVQGGSKEDALRFVIEATRLGPQVESGYLLNLMLAREGVAPTAVGEGVAIPQLVDPNALELECPMVTLAFLEDPIDFDSFDGKPCRFSFVCSAPACAATTFCSIDFIMPCAIRLCSKACENRPVVTSCWVTLPASNRGCANPSRP